MFVTVKSTKTVVWLLLILCLVTPASLKTKVNLRGKNAGRTITPSVTSAPSTITQSARSTTTEKTSSSSNTLTRMTNPTTFSSVTYSSFTSTVHSSIPTTPSTAEADSVSTSTSSDLDTSSAGCKSNEWMNVDGVCYLFVFSESLSFYEAETYCLKYNAHLTSLHSLPTNYKISKIMWYKVHAGKVHPSAYWIGLALRPLKNLLVASWTNNSTVDYSNYLLPPSAPTPEDRCTEIQYMANEWRDADCTKKNHFICAMPAMHSKNSKPSTSNSAEKSKPTGPKCVCAGCITCYVFVAILGLLILLMTRKCFWSLMKTGRFSSKSNYPYKAVMKDLSKTADDETDDDF